MSLIVCTDFLPFCHLPPCQVMPLMCKSFLTGYNFICLFLFVCFLPVLLKSFPKCLSLCQTFAVSSMLFSSDLIVSTHIFKSCTLLGCKSLSSRTSLMTAGLRNGLQCPEPPVVHVMVHSLPLTLNTMGQDLRALFKVGH